MHKKTVGWSAENVAAALGVTIDIHFMATGISIDSRHIQPGEIFIAIQGEKIDGHQFVEESLKKNAALAIVSTLSPEWANNPRIIVVPNTFAALYQLAAYQRQKVDARYIAVTGSVGKTSTKEMLQLLLSRKGKSYASKGNLNNHYGVPLSLCNMPADTQYAVFEMGMNHAGEITPLTQLVRPHVALITTIEAVHLEYFDSVEQIAAAKAEIFAGLMPQGTAIINADNPHYDYLKEQAVKHYHVKKIQSFGRSEKADCRLLEAEAKNGITHVKAQLGEQRFDYQLGCLGNHQVLNSLGVLLVLNAFGLDVTECAASLAEFTGTSGRGSVQQLRLSQDKKITVIDDSYNASPASMKAAIEVLATYPGRKIAVLGDMLELGSAAPLLHQQLGKILQENNIDKVMLAGIFMANLYQELPPMMRAGYDEKAESLLPLLEQFLQDQDVVLLKGSHGTNIHGVAKSLIHRLTSN